MKYFFFAKHVREFEFGFSCVSKSPFSGITIIVDLTRAPTGKIPFKIQ